VSTPVDYLPISALSDDGMVAPLPSFLVRDVIVPYCATLYC